MKNTIAILLILISVNCFGQTNGTNGQDKLKETSTGVGNVAQSAQDSLKKVVQENQKLFRESFTINAALIDSAMKKIEGVITMKDIKERSDNYKYYQNCEGFVQFLFEIWLENRKKKK